MCFVWLSFYLQLYLEKLDIFYLNVMEQWKCVNVSQSELAQKYFLPLSSMIFSKYYLNQILITYLFIY